MAWYDAVQNGYQKGLGWVDGKVGQYTPTGSVQPGGFNPAGALQNQIQDPTRLGRADQDPLEASLGRMGSTSQGFLNAIGQYNRAAPQMDTAMFQQAANGQAPSAAEMQMRAGQEANVQNMMAMQASQRGGYNPAMARQALATGAEQGQTVNAQAAQLRAQEQASARGQFLQALQGNQSAYLNNQGQNDQAQAGLRHDATSLMAGQAQGYQNQAADENKRQETMTQNRTNMFGSLTGAGGAAIAAIAAAAHGGYIPGHAKVVGDSPENDTVPAKLSPGELVVPRSVVAQGPQAIAAFASQAPSVHPGGGHAAGGFLQAAQASPAHFGHVLQALAAAHEKIGALKAKGGKRA